MHDKVIETIEGLTTKINASGKHTGTLGVTAEQTIFWHRRGINWIVSSAPKFLQAGAAAYLDTVKSPLGI